jgi:hypothetical protein
MYSEPSAHGKSNLVPNFLFYLFVYDKPTLFNTLAVLPFYLSNYVFFFRPGFHTIRTALPWCGGMGLLLFLEKARPLFLLRFEMQRVVIFNAMRR